jgi:hypothetical protein
MQTKQWLRRKEAAAYLTEQGFPTTASTLQKYATVGGGPQFMIFGNKALYSPVVLDAWALAKLKARGSTSVAE